MASITEVALALSNDWQLSLPDSYDEEQLLDLLTNRVMQLIQDGPERFWQMMYRLDISERKLNNLDSNRDVARQVARLIYDRQLQKAASRAYFRSQNQEPDDELKW